MKKLFLLLLLFTGITLQAQERLNGIFFGLPERPVNAQAGTTQQIDTTLSLPFFDDFSNRSLHPNPLKWTDNHVIINNDNAVNPPTVGVATFDALNSLGNLHPFTGSSFRADSLTSHPIALDRYAPGDSLYISFFYQPGGNANMPERGDSLVLEFRGSDENWYTVWKAAGANSAPFMKSGQLQFLQALVGIDNADLFLHKDFQFRFRNYATVAQQSDWQSVTGIWNVDYVYLNSGRHRNDTLHPDVAFASKAPNMLARYTAMPYSQYRANFINEMRDSVKINIANLDGISHNVSYRYEVYANAGSPKVTGNPLHTYFGGNFYITPFSTHGYLNHQPFSNPPVNFFYFPQFSHEKVYFITRHILLTEASLGRKENDTIESVTLMANYFAYDDGTAEAGYGLNVRNGEFVTKFTLNQPDSLLGVNLFFRKTLTGTNADPFTLNIYTDAFGQPDQTVYSKTYTPSFPDSLNQFSFYRFDSVLRVNSVKFPGLTFYVGIQQRTANNINIGFDINNDASALVQYRIPGREWTQTLIKGAPMVRPVVGKDMVLITRTSGKEEISFRIFPNPAPNGRFSIELPEKLRNRTDLMVSILDMGGRLVEQMQFRPTVHSSRLRPGAYLVRITDGKTVNGTARIIIP